MSVWDNIDNAANQTEELLLEFPNGKLIPIKVKAVSMGQMNKITTKDEERRLYEMILLMLVDKPNGTVNEQINHLKNTLSISHINAIVEKSFGMTGSKLD